MENFVKTMIGGLIFGIVFVLIVVIGVSINQSENEKFDNFIDEHCDYLIIIKHNPNEPLDCYDFKAQKYMDEMNMNGNYCFLDGAMRRLYAECQRLNEITGGSQ